MINNQMSPIFFIWGSRSSVVRHLQLKQEALGSIPGGYPAFFPSNWLANVDEMKDLWCSNTVQLLSTQI